MTFILRHSLKKNEKKKTFHLSSLPFSLQQRQNKFQNPELRILDVLMIKMFVTTSRFVSFRLTIHNILYCISEMRSGGDKDG